MILLKINENKTSLFHYIIQNLFTHSMSDEISLSHFVFKQ